VATTCLIGLDAGTTSVRAGAFAPDGRLLALARRPTPTDRPQPGWVEHDADALWLAAAAALREVAAALPAGVEVAALAPATVGEAGLPVDGTGRALRPIIAWFDPRAVGYVRRWEETIGAARLYALAGMTLDGLFGANKVMWVRDHEPEVWARTAAWLSTEDWLLLRLTGQAATDYSIAGRTLLFERDRCVWSEELLAAAGLEARLMPPALPAGTLLAGLTPEAAAVTGLPAGTPVVTGGHDHLCAAFVARGGRPIPIDSTGTAEALVTPAAAPPPGDPGLAAHVNCYRDVEPDRLALLASVGFAGGLVDWLRRQVFRIGEEVPDAYAQMMAEVRRPLRPNGVLCFPEFGRGASPRWDPTGARGAFVGLTQGHDRGDLLQAALEASCFSLRANLAWVEEHLPVTVDRVRALGGAVRNPVWVQMKADLTGREIEVIDLPEAAALGAAVLAGVGAGVYPSHAAGAAAVAPSGSIVRPDPARRDAYLGLYELWRRLPDLVGPLARALDAGEA
jgi:xylulokinase